MANIAVAVCENPRCKYGGEIYTGEDVYDYMGMICCSKECAISLAENDIIFANVDDLLSA